MTTQLNAMKQALEALEPFSTPHWAGTGVDKANEAITSLLTAIAEAESRASEQAEKQEPMNWSVYNSGAKVASGLTFAEAWDYMTPERLARDWCAVCVVDQSNMPMTSPAAQPAPVQEPVACVQDLDEVKRKHLVYKKGMDWKDPLYTTPPAAPVQEPVAWVDWVNAVMSQAQVFASTWSLVGGRFDDGSAYDQAEEAKQELRTMLANPPAAQPAPVQETDKPLGLYEHRCPQVTGHRGPSFVCQKAGHGVNQDSYCNDCTCPFIEQPALVQHDKRLQLALEALAPLEKLFTQADEQGLLTGANVDCQIATNDLRKSAYAASDIRALLNTTPPEARQAPVQEPKQSEIFCGVDFADGVLSVSVLRRRPDDVAELLHSEQIQLQPPAAQRQWVGLTDEEIMEVKGIHDDPEEWPEVISEARALEAKLKEKNT
jgi:hypothetical protein